MTGKDIFIYYNGAFFAAFNVRGDEVASQCEAVEISGPTTGQWRQYIAGRKGWQIATNYLVTSSAQISDLLKVGNIYTVTIRDRAAGTTLTGSALCTECRITATVGTMANGSFQFVGTGALTPPQS